MFGVYVFEEKVKFIVELLFITTFGGTTSYSERKRCLIIIIVFQAAQTGLSK
jgi:hypothetical protein